MNGQSGRPTITATDLDGLYEYHNKAFVLVEAKYGDTNIKGGQEKAFKRLIESLNKPAAYILARHDIEDPSTDVPMSQSVVDRVYYKMDAQARPKWLEAEVKGKPLPDVIHAFIRRVDA